ncbi:unnamed protein product [Polarella glacialis]|uniref:Uncharacterized protein n=1 Tax=Polarella glacialis TaxID=89957 RepID=A0A813G147_POLGL|nr:unnamed protein product [Polarella glacialis]
MGVLYKEKPNLRAEIGNLKDFCLKHSDFICVKRVGLSDRLQLVQPKSASKPVEKQDPSTLSSSKLKHALALAHFVETRGGSIEGSQVAEFYKLHPAAKQNLGHIRVFCNLFSGLLRFEQTGGSGRVCCSLHARPATTSTPMAVATAKTNASFQASGSVATDSARNNQHVLALATFVTDNGGSIPGSRLLDFYKLHPEAKGAVGNIRRVCDLHSDLFCFEPDRGPGTVGCKLHVRLGVAAPSPVSAVVCTKATPAASLSTSGSDSIDADLDAIALSLSAFVAERGGRTTRSQVAKFCAQNPQAKKLLPGKGKLEQFCDMYPSLLQFDPTAGAGSIVCVQHTEAGSAAASSWQLSQPISNKGASADAHESEEDQGNSRLEAPRTFKPPDGPDSWSSVDPWSVALNMEGVVSPVSEGLMRRSEAAAPTQLVSLNENAHNADERDVGRKSVSSTPGYVPELPTFAKQTTPASSGASGISDDWEDAAGIHSGALASKSAHLVVTCQGDEPPGLQLQDALGHAQALCQVLAGLEAERQSSCAALQAREARIALSEAALAEREARLAKREEELQAAVALAFKFSQDLGSFNHSNNNDNNNSSRLAGVVSEA